MRLYIDVFVLGVSLSWGPCLSFCAPILLPYIAGTQKDWWRSLQVTLAFSLARIIAYVILSLISAGLGYYLIRRFYQTRAESVIYIAAGAFVVLLGTFILLGKPLRLHWCVPFKKPGAQGLNEMILLGFLIGFAPCAPLLGLLIYIAFNARNLLQAALLGVAFGAGTLVSPLVLFGPLAGGSAGFLLKKPQVYKIFSRVCGAILIYFGAEMVIRTLRVLLGSND